MSLFYSGNLAFCDKIVHPIDTRFDYNKVATAFASDLIGAADSQFDITDEGGNVFKYLWDGTGTDPGITALTFPIGKRINFNADNFHNDNNGIFTITGSGANYIEVTNVDGVAEANKTIGATGHINWCGRFYIDKAEFDETAIMVPYSGQTVIFNDPIINLAADTYLFFNSMKQITWQGRFTLRGVGKTAAEWSIIKETGCSLIDLSGCLIICDPDYSADNGANPQTMVDLNGNDNKFNIAAYDIDITNTGGALVFYSIAGHDGHHSFALKNCTGDGAATTKGVLVAGDYNTITARVNALTNTAANADGVEILAGAQSTGLIGQSVNCDDNYTDGGGGTKDGSFGITN